MTTATGKIGIFDSGLGGLFIAKAVRAHLPDYDYVYLGDTMNLPYGKRSDADIYRLSENAMRFLFDQGCEIVIMACNTASAAALRKLQQRFLAREYPERRILGVVIPTLEKAIDHGATRIGLIATQRTVSSGIYETELRKLNPVIALTAVATPLLVPLIEDGGEAYLHAVLNDYLHPLIKARAESLILGCTHYAIIKGHIRALLPDVEILSQDDIIPEKLKDYLSRHVWMAQKLSKKRTFQLYATDANPHFARNAADMAGGNCVLLEAAYAKL